MNSSRGIALGIVLLATGGYFLLARRFDFSGPGAILVLIGTVFLALAAVRGMRGPLLPGGVLLGLGAGFLARQPLAPALPPWATLLLGLGAGFLLVAALDHSAGRERRPSPLVPGVVLVTIALLAAISGFAAVREMLDGVRDLWPWALVLAGAILLAQAVWRRRA